MEKFIVDTTLGKLAKWLRSLGFDTTVFPGKDLHRFVQIAQKEKRIILTRDKALYERKKADCFYLESVGTTEQLREIITFFRLAGFSRSFSRCIVCNTPLKRIDKEAVAERLPSKVLEHFSHFDICPGCERIYWQGDHYKHMKVFVQKLFASIGLNKA